MVNCKTCTNNITCTSCLNSSIIYFLKKKYNNIGFVIKKDYFIQNDKNGCVASCNSD